MLNRIEVVDLPELDAKNVTLYYNGQNITATVSIFMGNYVETAEKLMDLYDISADERKAMLVESGLMSGVPPIHIHTNPSDGEPAITIGDDFIAIDATQMSSGNLLNLLFGIMTGAMSNDGEGDDEYEADDTDYGYDEYQREQERYADQMAQMREEEYRYMSSSIGDYDDEGNLSDDYDDEGSPSDGGITWVDNPDDPSDQLGYDSAGRLVW